MTEVQRLPAICPPDDCEGERGERGKRGHRGATGPTGPAGPESGALLGRQVFNVAGNGTYTPTPGARSAIVRGCGGGGGGGGVGPSGANDAAGVSGGNSGTAIEVEVVAPLNTLLTGGPITVGAGAPGMVGNSSVQTGGDSTLVIGGVTLTAPGGVGGNSGGNGFLIPNVVGSPPPNAPAIGVDYQAADPGGYGFANTLNNVALRGGDGGSGDFGIGGLGSNGLVSNGNNASGNGAGGGGASQRGGQLADVTGGAGTPGLWIIEEYA